MEVLEQGMWQHNYVQSLFGKYKDVPDSYKYMLIEKDYSKMFGGKREAQHRMKYMYNDSETFIFAFDNAVCEFSKVVKKNLFKKYCEDLALSEHYELIKSGFFWEFFPHLQGIYLKDKEDFCKFVIEREVDKNWLNIIL